MSQTDTKEDIVLEGERTFHLKGEVNQETILPILDGIIYANVQDYGLEPEERTPILIFISSIGGDEDFGYALIDVIDESKTPIYTINIGGAMSMGSLILMAGHKRYSLKSSMLLIHAGGVDLQSTNYLDWVKTYNLVDYQHKKDAKTKEYVLSHSDIPAEIYDQRFKDDWYLFSDEAKELGIIDGIIGLDTSLEEVLNA